MSAAANWSYTAVATVWKKLGMDDYGKSSFAEPIQIMCDYGGDATARLGDIGLEFVVKTRTGLSMRMHARVTIS